MMYRHTVTLYDENGNLLSTIPDQVDLKAFGFIEYEGDSYLGGPVEAVFSHNGNYLWVSQYQMYGKGFNNPGCDACNGSGYDPSFVYKINTASGQIDNVIKVGSVPKFMQISKDESVIVVTNWSSGDVSIIDVESEQEVKRVKVGAHPRGVAISSDASVAYVTVMGSTKVAAIDLDSYEVSYIEGMGRSPRHLVLTANDSILYVAANSSNEIIRYDISSAAKTVCHTRSGPRTMIMSPDEKYLYAVNYFDNSFSKIRTDSMTIVEHVKTGTKPIGITANWAESELWVACYSGEIEIFHDLALESSQSNSPLNDFASLFGFDRDFWATNESAAEQKPDKSTGLDEIAGVTPSEAIPSIQPKIRTESFDKADSRAFESEVETAMEVKDDEAEEVISSDATEKIETKGIVDREESAGTKTEDAVNLYIAKVHSATSKASKSAVENCTYHVIVGSFSVPENAESYKKSLTEKGLSAQVIAGSKLNYVSAQCFSSREQADASLPDYKNKLGVSGWILKR